MERLVLSKEEMMIEIKYEYSKNVKTKTIDDFTITQLKTRIKISHAFGNCNVVWNYGSFHVSKTYSKCFEFVIGNDKIVRVDFETLRNKLEHTNNLTSRRQTERNISKITDLMLRGFIESKLVGLEFERKYEMERMYYYVVGKAFTLTFSWNCLKSKNKQDVDTLVCNLDGITLPFSKFCEFIPEMKQLFGEKKKLIEQEQLIEKMQDDLITNISNSAK